MPVHGKALTDTLPRKSLLCRNRTGDAYIRGRLLADHRTLAEGRDLTKNNADCVVDPTTQTHLLHHRRDLNAGPAEAFAGAAVPLDSAQQHGAHLR
jgi:hypothetical protein